MQLNFPAYNFKIKRQENANYVFDIIRKKFILLTPEEWVRQHLVHFLANDRGFPLSRIAVERGLKVNGLKKRFDVLIFDSLGMPQLLAECKAPDIKLSEETLMQVSVYNSHFGAGHLLVTNGLQHFYFYSKNGKMVAGDGIPHYESIRVK